MSYFPTIDPIFGPTWANDYWSASPSTPFPGDAWSVDLFIGRVWGSLGMYAPAWVRAVRSGS